MRRNYDDADYKKARGRARRRDRRTCQMPGCSCRKRLQVHHIIPYSQRPDLRDDLSNLITLCYTCHKEVTGSEAFYESLFMGIIKEKKRR